ncbi:hypothetical protein ACERII_06590 [Evansella sp. AB-rgal1]|uniref:hypothetical protein n=1 Tax=Evansella sp. AB-rgal1 TaxID=3242696 RepID=UPI00359E2644
MNVSGYTMFHVFYNQQIFIQPSTTVPFMFIHVYIDEQLVRTYKHNQDISIPIHNIPSGTHTLSVSGEYVLYNQPYKANATYQFTINQRRETEKRQNSDYQAGDILVASDNKFGIPNGYMGHAVLIIDEDFMLESNNITKYSMKKIRIKSFFDEHQWYAHYRPIDPTIGKDAVRWGLDYCNKYEDSLKKGNNRPKFSFIPSDLKSLWDRIYCSKLIWSCYYYGAEYEFANSGLWFTPQNLDEELRSDENFNLIYKHPRHSFKIKI